MFRSLRLGFLASTSLLLLPGCNPLLPAAAATQDPDTSFDAPTKDGTRYVMVEGGRASSPAAVRGKWRRHARQACKGEYIVVSEAGSLRRTGGVVKSRSHEGYVQCTSPEGVLEAVDPGTRKSANNAPAQ